MRKFAVVQWDSGEDAGMYSEVKTDAIRRYDDTKVDDDGDPQTDYSAAVEWQKGKKPKHGWPVYMASIKFVSNNRYHTNAKIKEFLGLESDERNKPLPKKRTPVPPSRYTDSDETDVENTPTQRKKTVIPKPQRNVAQMIVDEYQSFLLINDVKMALKSPCSSTSSVSSDLEGGQGLPQRITESTPQPSPTALPPPKAVSTEQTGLGCGPECKLCLLTAVFPIDVLLVSNLRGTSRDSGPQRQALDKMKVDAIYRATLQKWPHVVPSSIGAAINAKLTEIRGKKEERKNPETLMLFDD
ncbi:hypothetical protein G5714_002647 [Onychostoma macrolepis]|uniref:BEN domain-containing protein n=1 Tax=Onychostoma macrolepis TaxID=369639 RepID=A0A7J6D792_9TELE|nr:hypothetical protein G5714_002647 [Onychostoma macrolepis]